MKEHYYDKLLNIKTGADRHGGPSSKSLHYHPYEPTPYSALEELFRDYEVKSSDHIVDFGCGKGRLNFYLNYFFHAPVVGVEMDSALYHAALENRTRYGKKNGMEKIQFVCCLAEEYEISPLDNRFYFFNPFSVQVFRRIVNNILVSVETSPRDIELVLYYPSPDYIFFLEKETAFELQNEILVPFVSQHNPNERFLIYRLRQGY